MYVSCDWLPYSLGRDNANGGEVTIRSTDSSAQCS